MCLKPTDTVWIRKLGTKGNVYAPVLVEDLRTVVQHILCEDRRVYIAFSAQFSDPYCTRRVDSVRGWGNEGVEEGFKPLN